ncbi:O-fucosyltransferase family protein [Quillaja saponaria]|uniref:O-fucosyltransferase family protein n=1 Tax=Quillaja saponaria TaxID=32244 RepID=A0AAD7LTM9_QUISA|nr:O-fucosyltransferase family protein [Quillaja saponaria]
MVVFSVKPLFSVLVISIWYPPFRLSIILFNILCKLHFIGFFNSEAGYMENSEEPVEWRPCSWWLQGHLTDVYDVDYFIQQINGFVKVVRKLPPVIASKEPFRVDCSKRKGQFDYIESVLPSLLGNHYIWITPAMSQRRDRYSVCKSCTLSSLL